MAIRLPIRRRPSDPLVDDKVAYESDLVTVGHFSADVDHPRFCDSGPISRAIFVFPRTSVVIRNEGHAPFTTDTCTVTFYNEGQRYTRAAVDPRGDKCEWFSVRADVLTNVLARHDPAVRDRPDRPFAYTHGLSDATTYALQRLIVRYVRSAAKPDQLAVEEAVVRVLERIVALAYGRTIPAAKDQPCSRSKATVLAQHAQTYLANHFDKPLSLDDIASAVSSSVFHLCRVFHREVGTTIHSYRQQLRLRHSLELVAERGSNLTEIALHLGFSSHSHFSAVFRQAFNTSPSEFRRYPSGRSVRELAQRLAATERARA